MEVTHKIFRQGFDILKFLQSKVSYWGTYNIGKPVENMWNNLKGLKKKKFTSHLRPLNKLNVYGPKTILAKRQ